MARREPRPPVLSVKQQIYRKHTNNCFAVFRTKGLAIHPAQSLRAGYTGFTSPLRLEGQRPGNSIATLRVFQQKQIELFRFYHLTCTRLLIFNRAHFFEWTE